jgi:hypothetical protein
MDTPVPAKKSNLLPGTACEFLATRLFVWLLQTSQRYRQETPVLRLSKFQSFFFGDLGDAALDDRGLLGSLVELDG